MKKVFLLYILFSSAFLCAQNWMPFNSSDQRIHFLMEDTLYIQNGFSSFFSPIQSVVLKNQFIHTSGKSLTFKKGFNIQTDFNSQNQLIKGQMLGDSAVIMADTTKFYSRDSLGFELIFPHSYHVNTSFIIGKNPNRRINSYVDSIRIEQVNGQMDSVVFITQKVFNSNNQRDTVHPLDNTLLKISKNYGIIACMNYSNLSNSRYYSRYFTNDTISEAENNRLNIGDEVHWVLDSVIGFPYKYRNCISRVDSISWNGSLKKVFFSNYRQNPITSMFYYLHNKTYDIIDTSKVYQILESNIIEDSCLNSNLCTPNNRRSFSISKNQLNSLQSLDFRQFTTPNSSNLFDSLYGPRSSLAGNYWNRVIGIWDEDYAWGFNGVGANHIKRNIVYYRVGNQTWGYPFNFITNIKNLEPNINQIELWPNPAQEELMVQLTNYSNGIQEIQVFDLLGKEQTILLERISSSQMRLNTRNLKRGVYLIKVKTNKTWIIKKLVKN